MKNQLRKGILESPYAGDMRGNRIFAENVARAVLVHRGWNLFGSHLYYPHFLNELEPEERKLGIEAGLQWAEGCNLVLFALPEWVATPSTGMYHAYKWHTEGEAEIFFGVFQQTSGVATCRHWLTPEQFFHPDGWVAGLKADS